MSGRSPGHRPSEPVLPGGGLSETIRDLYSARFAEFPSHPPDLHVSTYRMRRLTTLLFGMALGGGLVFAAHHYHLVRTGKQFLLIPKIEVSLVDPYVDVRDWHLDDWEEHPELLAAMQDHGHADLLPKMRSGDARSERTDALDEDDSADHLGPIPERLIPGGLVPRSGASDNKATRRQ